MTEDPLETVRHGTRLESRITEGLSDTTKRARLRHERVPDYLPEWNSGFHPAGQRSNRLRYGAEASLSTLVSMMSSVPTFHRTLKDGKSMSPED
jgi:hypothetical protein